MASKTDAARKLTALKRAIAIAGSPVELSRALGYDDTIVGTWLQRGQVSHKAALRVQDITGVPCYELRPDLYRKPAEVVA